MFEQDNRVIMLHLSDIFQNSLMYRTRSSAYVYKQFTLSKKESKIYIDLHKCEFNFNIYIYIKQFARRINEYKVV